MSWLNWEPKSRTKTVCRRADTCWGSRGKAAGFPRTAAVWLRLLAHAHVLGLLKHLALRGDRRRDHQLDVLELRDVACAAHAKRRTQRAGEILRAVVDPRRAEQDLAQRRPGADLDPRAAREVGIGRRHAPVESLRRRLFRASEGRADHHAVAARRERLAHVGPDPHPAARDDTDPHPAPTHVPTARAGPATGG